MYEISFNPKSSSEAISDLNKFKDILFKTAETFGFKAIYQPKPYDRKPGCGMHIHLGIFDKSGQSKLTRISEYQESQYMLNVVGGLCSTILKNFTIFAPNEDSYKRFDASINVDQQSSENQLASHNNAPVNVSWGGNNRTTAIRIPTSTIDENTRHIEHRVAGVDADPEKVIEAILEGVYIGLKEELQPPEKIYGNAFDEQYNFLEPFPKTLAEAEQLKAKYNN
jgi:glutamine synthetase